MANRKHLLQSFTSQRGNLIEVIESTRVAGDIKHWIKVNGVMQDRWYRHKELLGLVQTSREA